MDSMRKIAFTLALAILSSFAVMAQGDRVRRGGCTPTHAVSGSDALMAPAAFRLPAINRDWDSNRTYRQLVILFSFGGDNVDFRMDDPKSFYNNLFNTPGFNERLGVGCVADYFRDQSGGRLNLQFDVYGPYKIDEKSQPYDNPTENTMNRGKSQMRKATNMFLEENPSLDFSVYDWNDDGRVNQVVFVYAGVTGNQDSKKSYGHIWPNTSSFSSIKTPDGKVISNYTCSAEHLTNGNNCSIGTICHEFSHSLGLPDIYPVGDDASLPFSIADEWDLMDGGNFTNDGACPPNYTALEKYLMGWLDYKVLTEPSTVTGLKPLSQGGTAYIINHTDNEYVLLENRQQVGWDLGLPGKGLVAYHVNYIASKWSSNTVNSTVDYPNFSLFNADDMDYSEWEDYVIDVLGITKRSSLYANPNYMNSLLLSGSAYPYTDALTLSENDSLTALSTLMYNQDAEGSYVLDKPLTNIRIQSDGTVSFNFMGGGKPTGIAQLNHQQPASVLFDLNGRPRSAIRGKGLFIERRADGSTRKILK